jgi:hypothetical protein
VSISRRGYFAAGLAVAVVGSLGGFALNANAEEAADAPAAAEASAEPDAPATVSKIDEDSPPPLLPWGEKPEEPTLGPVNATSEQLAKMGADAAPPPKDTRKFRKKRGLKGFDPDRRTQRHGRTAVPPQPPSLLAAEEPDPGPPYYHYGTAYQFVEAEGSHANLTVYKPTLADYDHHSLAEIAVRSEDRQNTVEVGWTVDPAVNGGSLEPHLFVFFWVNGKGMCYNVDCKGWVQKGSISPGGKLPVGTQVRMGIQFFNDAWWIAVNSEWIGKYPATEWTDRGTKFTQANLIQWFGEVASPSLEPCSTMGRDFPAIDKTSTSSARIGTISILPPGASQSIPASVTVYANSKYRKAGPVYTALAPSGQNLWYGGPPITEVTDEDGKSVPNPACRAKPRV